MSDSKRLILIDGMALVYRGHFALMRNPRMTSSGLNTSAIFVFLNVLMDLMKNHAPDYLAVAFDTPEPTFRHKEYEPYKAQREKMPEDIQAALPYVFKLCEGMNIPILRMPGWEADDVIGTLAGMAEQEGLTTIMVTPDKDYAQLVSEKTLMYKPAHRGAGFDVLGVPEILEKWGVERVDQVIDVLGLMGDTSDNIPGVPGVGEKTAQKLIAKYGSVEKLLESTDELKGKQKENVENNRELAALSKRLVTICREVPVEVPIADLILKAHDEVALKSLFVELEFKSIGKRLFGDDFESEMDQQRDAASDVPVTCITDTFHDYQCIDSAEGRAELAATLSEEESFCFDLETDGLDARHCKPLGMAISYRPNEAFYVALSGDDAEIDAQLAPFVPALTDTGIEKIGHNLKFDCTVLRQRGIRLAGPIFDTMLAAYLVMPEEKRSMDALALRLLHYRAMPITDLIGPEGDEQITLSEVPLEKIVDYAGEDADITFQLAEELRPMLGEFNQEKLFHEVEAPLLLTLVEMEHEGIRVDPSRLEDLSTELGKTIETAEARAHELAGEPFALSSPKQLGEVLFDKLDIEPKPKRTAKSGQYQTNEQILSRLAGKHEIVQSVLDYRMCSKLKSTYVDALPNSIDARSGRVHTHYDQAVTATGRLNSHDPNLQNIPIRTEMGREIRKAFVPRDENYQLLSADYSQIELRIAAELSEDPNMMSAFTSDLDFHTATAAMLHGLEPLEVTPELRRNAKTVNFGILYGISAFGLSERSDMSRSEAKELIETYFATYAKLRTWLDEVLEKCRETGYVETLLGRRRYIRDINSRNGTIRAAAERNAMNAPIQGTAADLIKIAMHRMQAELDERKMKSRLLLQVHDELVFDMHTSESDELPNLVRKIMVGALDMKVPIVVEMGAGEDWLEAH